MLKRKWPVWAGPLAVLVLIAVAGHLGNGGVAPVAVTGRQLMGEHLENVMFTGTLTARAPAKHGVGTSLKVETAEGYVLSVYLSPDVAPAPLREGDRLQLIGSTSGPGVVSVTRADGLKLLPHIVHTTRSHLVTVGDTALFSVGDRQVRVPLPHGDHGGGYTVTTTSTGASYLDPDD